MASERLARRDLFIDASLGVYVLPAVEKISLEIRPRGWVSCLERYQVPGIRYHSRREDNHRLDSDIKMRLLVL